MNARSFLVFQVRQSFFGVDARLVRETISLPELVPIEEVPPFIVGIFNLRGTMVPVMDLSVRFGHPPLRYRLADDVVVVRDGTSSLGLIVNDVVDVVVLEPEEIYPEPFPGPEGGPHPHFIFGEARAGGNLVMILNTTTLLDFEFQIPEIAAAGAPTGYFCPEAGLREKEAFSRRAVDLAKPPADEDLTGRVPVAVIELNGEYFGIETKVVREFSNLQTPVPVPCCPGHIVGSLNHRGTILTVIDIRQLLNMPVVHPARLDKVVVLAGDALIGVAVEDICDVVSLSPSEIIPAPALVATGAESYVLGMAPHGGGIITVLDLARMVADEKLLVQEEA